jgi:hypothetical protein
VLDVSGVIPEARPIVQRAAAVYLKHTGPWFVGLLVHGSAVKGGAIPGCSDVDFQLYLDPAAFAWHGQLPLELAFAIRRELEAIDLAPFRYLQCYPRRPQPEEGLVGPIPGGYYLVAGRLPVPEATAEQLRESAVQALSRLDPAPAFLVGELLGAGGVRLARKLRLLCTIVWPVLYHVLTLQHLDAIAMWRLPKDRAIEWLPQGTALHESASRFHRSVRSYYPAEESLEGAFALVEAGVAFLEAACSWWNTNRDTWTGGTG